MRRTALKFEPSPSVFNRSSAFRPARRLPQISIRLPIVFLRLVTMHRRCSKHRAAILLMRGLLWIPLADRKGDSARSAVHPPGLRIDSVTRAGLSLRHRHRPVQRERGPRARREGNGRFVFREPMKAKSPTTRRAAPPTFRFDGRKCASTPDGTRDRRFPVSPRKY